MVSIFSFSRRARWHHFASIWSLHSRMGVYFGFQWINTFFHSSEAILYGSLHLVQGLQNCVWKLRLISLYYAEGVIDVRQFARKARLIGSFQLLLDWFKSTQDLMEFRGIRRSVQCHFSHTEFNQSDREVENVVEEDWRSISFVSMLEEQFWLVY